MEYINFITWFILHEVRTAQETIRVRRGSSVYWMSLGKLLKQIWQILQRMDVLKYIRERSRGMRVMHIGCVDVLWHFAKGKNRKCKIKKNSYGFTLDNLKPKKSYFWFLHFQFLHYRLYKVSEYINATIVSTLLNSSLKWWQTKSSRCAQSQNPSVRTIHKKLRGWLLVA